MMTKNLYNRLSILRATATLILALSLSTFPAALTHAVNAQTPWGSSPTVRKGSSTNAIAAPSEPSPPSTNTSTSGESESKGGPKEGIKVHGHWVIDVRNPDGTLVTHRDFENSLTVFGAQALADILFRNVTVSDDWQIILRNSSATLSPCVFSSLNPSATHCTIAIPTNMGTAPYYFKNLIVSRPLAGVNANKLVFSGMATAQRPGTINQVETNLTTCSPSVTPTNCNAAANDSGQVYPSFTQFSLTGSPGSPTAPVDVVEGQLIQVTVTISFS